MEANIIEEFVEKARANDVELKETIVKPQSLVKIAHDETGNAVVVEREDIANLAGREFRKGDSVVLDFGDHEVGYVTLDFDQAGSPQDAPAFIRLKFAEIPQEILDDSSTYDGWISKGWIQEEFIHMDVLPCKLELPRRYSFRYLEVLVIDTSQKFTLTIEGAQMRAVSAVDMADVEPLKGMPEDIQAIDRVSLKTLQDCMQHVFEDGPKRDRRLWIGDLRLQALANYATFDNLELVRRCMYLFAGMTRADGKICSCVFVDPVEQPDDTFLWDYSLFFIPILFDYYKHTGDEDIVRELWAAAYRQIEIAQEDFTDGVLDPQFLNLTPDTTCPTPAFIDWKEGVEKQAAEQGVWIYALRRAAELGKIAGTAEENAHIDELLQDALAHVTSNFWDAEREVFVSGDQKQVNWITQAWLALADAAEPEQLKAAINNALADPEAVGVLTPYAYHHVVEALLHVGEKDKALELMRGYWGKMVDLGADTFWEAFDPEDPLASPYGNMQINSFCHAWSCTPAWLLREYF